MCQIKVNSLSDGVNSRIGATGSYNFNIILCKIFKGFSELTFNSFDVIFILHLKAMIFRAIIFYD